jgi:hypothetical protein
MRLRGLRRALAGVAIACGISFVGGYVLAQNAPPPGDAPADVDVPMKKRANISPGDMMKQADQYQLRMQEVFRRVVQLQEVARKQKDVIKLNCVNDKLLQVKQLMNISDSAKTNLQEAITRGDEEGRYHEFSRITIADQQISILGTEAENCIGEDLSFLGPTEVIVEEPEEPDDPTRPQDPLIPEVEPPPVASPFA